MLNNLISKNILEKVRSSQNFYSLTNNSQKYKLSELPWPKLYAIHGVQYKYKITSFPPNWNILRENFPELKMKSWDGDGRKMEFDTEIGIMTTPSSILLHFRKGYRCFSPSISEAEEFIQDKFETGPIQHLESLGFKLSPEPPIKTNMEYAFPEIILSKSKNRWKIVNENGKTLIKKDGSPEVHDEIEVEDEEIGQSILDVANGYKKNSEKIEHLSKTQTKIATELTVFSTKLENSSQSFEDRIEKLEIRTDNLSVKANSQEKNYHKLKENVGKVLGLFEQTMDQIEKKDHRMESLETKMNNLNENLLKIIESSKTDPEPGGLYT